jgi:hypothetical protein
VGRSGAGASAGEYPKLTPREYDLPQELITPRRQGADASPPHPGGKANAGAANVQAVNVHIRHQRQEIEAVRQTPGLVETELNF